MRRYLLVDDNAPFVENLAEILREDGHEVAFAHDGEAALALILGTRFDALVSDLRMPRMDGAALLERLRAVDPGLPVIFLSGDGEVEPLLLLHPGRPVTVLRKPPRVEELLALLSRAHRTAPTLPGEP